MEIPKIHESEYRFCLILWENEPIKSGELVRLCQERLGWKSTTTYTVLKRLSERGIVQNQNTVVTSLVSRDQVQEAEADEVVQTRFGGSVPAFLAAFTRKQRLSPGEIDQLQAMIDRFREEAAE
jgi:predicted transcriptional regulator